MISIRRLLPGELDDAVDPRRFGFGVERADNPSREEAALRVGRFYQRTKELTGVTIPKLEPYLRALPESARSKTNGHNGA